ncbi:MAG: glycosyltransferase family 4 protein [Bacteroidales bacterium]|nr:glycosyltransferase family 4 protein [Bacteroidales bacterium]
MKIGVIGTRGFPDIQGGIETHCQELYTRLAEGYDSQVTVYRRIPYLNEKNRDAKYTNIRFIDFKVPRNKFLETFLHSFLASVHALFQRYDIVHYHNTGPGFFIPIVKLSRARVVFTYHNISYTQQKWNVFARKFLAGSEWVSMRRSDYIIFISEVIKAEMVEKYGKDDLRYSVVFNGVRLPERAQKDDFLTCLGLKKNGYILGVGRFLEEKGFDYLIRAYRKTGISDMKLVLAGDTDYPTEYSDNLKKLAAENEIILPGFIKGDQLNQLYTFAHLFVISSYSEGLPIALLEAMSYDLDVLASDIPANLQVGLAVEDYFKTGNEEDLSNAIIKKLGQENKRSFSEVLSKRFNWTEITRDTLNIYQKLITTHES